MRHAYNAQPNWGEQRALIGDGLDWDELDALAGPLARSRNLLGVVTTCYNPEKDPDGACGRRLGRFLEGVVEANP
jgi:arginase